MELVVINPKMGRKSKIDIYILYRLEYSSVAQQKILTGKKAENFLNKI